MKRKFVWPTKIQVYDKIFRFTVYSLAGWAALGAGALVFTYVHFLIKGRPAIQKRNRELREQQLAREQAEIEAVLLEEQKKAELLG